jgi:Zn-dependent protease
MELGILGIGLSLLILVYSAILHEIAHGFVAERLGDPTARILGRLTLNPIPHIDIFMTILLPLLLLISGSPVIFGGAKPVPVDSFNLRDGRKDMALVSLAGPGTNLLLAIAASLGIRLLLLLGSPAVAGDFFLGLLFHFLTTTLQINLLLAIFNLLPIPPLDGSKIFALVLPEDMAAAYLSLGQFGIVILLALLYFPIGSFSIGTLIFHLLQFSQHLLLPST